jgi:hypothetical protein
VEWCWSEKQPQCEDGGARVSSNSTVKRVCLSEKQPQCEEGGASE